MGGLKTLPEPAAIDAVTLDAYDTLVELDDPVGRLGAALAAAGVVRAHEDVARAFRAEVAHYAARKCSAATPKALAALRASCADVFTRELGAELDFTEQFSESLVFRVLPGVERALRELRARGFALAVISNWDCSLIEQLARVGIAVDTVVTCAGAGTAKPGPRPFLLALAALGVEPARALHVGDSPDDRNGARAAGLHFAPAPLDEVVARWR